MVSLSSVNTPPDEVELTVDASGNISLKSKTQGDILYFGASGAPAYLAAGVSGKFLKTLGAGANPTWADAGGEWIHLETLSASADTTVTSGALAAYDQYKVKTALLAATAGTPDLQMRFNTDSGTNYHNLYMDGTTPTSSTTSTFLTVGTLNNGMESMAEVILRGITSATANGALGFTVVADWVGGGARGLGGIWKGGNAVQITSVTVFPASDDMTGKVEIFGRNFNA